MCVIVYRHPSHPDLHSFPTRRSSDLILLREAFSLFVLQAVAIRQDAPTVILDVSCGPGDYSVAWTSQIARFLPKGIDRKSTRLNSSHSSISYAGLCLKKINAFKRCMS